MVKYYLCCRINYMGWQLLIWCLVFYNPRQILDPLIGGGKENVTVLRDLYVKVRIWTLVLAWNIYLLSVAPPSSRWILFLLGSSKSYMPPQVLVCIKHFLQKELYQLLFWELTLWLVYYWVHSRYISQLVYNFFYLCSQETPCVIRNKSLKQCMSQCDCFPVCE